MDRTKLIKILKRGLIITGVVILLLLSTLVLTYFTNLDIYLLSPKLSGVVKDSITLQPVNNADIFLNNEKFTTNEVGEFNIPLTSFNDLKFDVLKDKYNTLEQEIDINKAFLTSVYYLEIFLIPQEKGIVNGKFITELDNYNFAGDKLFLNDEPYPISTDGSFKISNVSEGEVNFVFESPNFIDIDKEILIKPTDNFLEDIVLVNASDIVGTFKDWVNETTTVKADIKVTDVSDDLITVLDNGEFKVKDLVPSRTYDVRVSHQNYLTRDYSVTTKLGNNEILDLKMVPNDIYSISTGKVNNKVQILKSDLDGMNEVAITSINNLAPTNVLLSDSLVYFVDDFENIRGNGSSLDILYAIDISNPNFDVNRVTTTTTGLTEIYSFAKQKVLIDLSQDRSSSNRKFYISTASMDGNNLKVINTLQNVEYQQFIPSLNSVIVYYTYTENDTDLFKLIKYSSIDNSNELILSSENIELYDLTLDGEYLVYSRLNDSTGFNDLYVYESSTKSNRLIMQNHNGNLYQFDPDNNDLIYFYSKRDGRENIYKYNYSSNTTDRVTFLDLDEEFNNLYINDRYIFYVLEDKGIYLLDKYIPKNYKLVKAFD